MKCLHCGVNDLPRLYRKYCSDRCNKRAWYLRNSKVENSTLLSDDAISNSQKGFYWEKKVAELFNGEVNTHESRRNPVDITIDGKNCDVKSCEIYKRKKKRGKRTNLDKTFGQWIFNRGKMKECIDYFFCVCLRNNNLERIYRIPNNKFPKTGVSIGNKSKYDPYRVY